MTMSTDTVAEVDATAEFDDGGVLSAQTHERDIDLRIQTPDHRPLSSTEPHAQLTVSGEGLTVDIVLDADALETLGDAVRRAQADE